LEIFLSGLVKELWESDKMSFLISKLWLFSAY
jgi:hypothetical protein